MFFFNTLESINSKVSKYSGLLQMPIITKSAIIRNLSTYPSPTPASIPPGP